MLKFACLKRSLIAIACAVSSGHEGPFEQIGYGSLVGAVFEFNKMAFDRNYNFRLGVHIGGVVSPPENLVNDHVRFALDSDEPMITVWILEEGLLSPVMGIVRELIRKGVSGSGCIVKTGVPVHIFDPGSVLL